MRDSARATRSEGRRGKRQVPRKRESGQEGGGERRRRERGAAERDGGAREERRALHRSAGPGSARVCGAGARVWGPGAGPRRRSSHMRFVSTSPTTRPAITSPGYTFGPSPSRASRPRAASRHAVAAASSASAHPVPPTAPTCRPASAPRPPPAVSAAALPRLPPEATPARPA